MSPFVSLSDPSVAAPVASLAALLSVHDEAPASGPVPAALLEEILEVASYAPSGVNSQPWLLYVAGQDAWRNVAARLAPDPLADAAAGTVLVFTVSAAMGSGALLDYGMFIQSLRLAARARGVTSYWRTVDPTQQPVVLQGVGAPPDQRLVGVMAVGLRAVAPCTAQFVRFV